MRMDEAMTLFRAVLKKGFLRHKTVMLFFNKFDLLLEKLQDERSKTIDQFLDGWDETQNPRDPQAVCDFVFGKFLEIYKTGTGTGAGAGSATSSGGYAQLLHFHTTSALDTEQINHIMTGIESDLIRKQLRMAGL